MAYITQYMKWQDFKIEVRFAPDRFNLNDQFDNPMAHLEVNVYEPPKAAIPITETGYRSHFTPQSEILAHGSPANFVKKWLDEKAKSKE